MIGQGDTPQLDVVFGRNAQLGMYLKIAMALAEFRPSLRENDFVILCRAQCRLMSGGPAFSRRHVAQIEKRAPARKGEIVPATIAAASVADGDVIAAVGKKMNFRRARGGTLEDPYDTVVLTEPRSHFLQFKVFWQHAGLLFGKSFLQQ